MNSRISSSDSSSLPNLAWASQPPTLAWALGLAGLIPFVLGSALQWYGPPGWRMLAGMALLSYGAVIVSFLGGIHWGLAMRASPVPVARLVWGVLPRHLDLGGHGQRFAGRSRLLVGLSGQACLSLLANQRPRMNSASSSRTVIWRQVGRPWLHWSERSVCSI